MVAVIWNYLNPYDWDSGPIRYSGCLIRNFSCWNCPTPSPTPSFWALVFLCSLPRALTCLISRDILRKSIKPPSSSLSWPGLHKELVSWYDRYGALNRRWPLQAFPFLSRCCYCCLLYDGHQSCLWPAVSSYERRQ